MIMLQWRNVPHLGRIIIGASVVESRPNRHWPIIDHIKTTWVFLLSFRVTICKFCLAPLLAKPSASVGTGSI
ncbi:hypothetical protein Agabi119p4_1084 [Agaricus bisporus var. burnettii]|uniref:Uncharacterized protein n=1 Tax=Agaricus bisporus var. burnettii TaxID=192524 RepID=A0A8H7FBX5_AGABI|nr:hypothetical protein Agabi119p4_1084 [Agaricus bisporus var. burnettii]